MRDVELDRQVSDLVATLSTAAQSQRNQMAAQIAQVIAALKDRGRPVPPPLRRFEVEDEDDFFDNMPV